MRWAAALEAFANATDIHAITSVLKMKSKKIILAGAVALACASLASSQTTIRITGSTAFRSATVTSIKNLLNTGYDAAYTGTSDTGAQYATFVGTTNAAGISGQSVIVQCAWTGSVEGVRDVSQGLTQPFIKASQVIDAGGTGTTTNTASITTTTTNTTVYENAIPEIALADNTQAATIYPTPSLAQQQVGVIPFVFLKGRVDAAHPASSEFGNITNITNQLAQALFTGGVNISLFTGVVDTTQTKLYAMGRNPLSGTRLVTFAETGYGASSNATQFRPVVAGNVTTGTITGIDLYLTETSGFGDGNNSYSSGGTLADELGRIVTDTTGSGNAYDGVPFGLIGYVGVTDAARMLKNINTTTAATVSYVLSYNGVSLSPVYDSVAQTTTWDFTPVKEGKYSMWSYEYLTYRDESGPNGTVAYSGVGKTFADQLSLNIQSTLPSSAGIKLSDMKVTRSSEGSPITSL